MRWTELPEGPFLASIGGLFAGVALYSFFPLGWSFPLWCTLLALALLLVSPRSLPIFLFFIALGLGAARMGLAEESLPPSSQLADMLGRQQAIEGRVVSDPERREQTLRIVIGADKIGERDIPRIRILAIFDSAEVSEYGDKIVVRGVLEEPESFETESGRTFNYEMYLRKDGISALLRNPAVLSSESSSSLRGALYSFKEKLEEGIGRIVPEPGGGLLKGMLLGERDALPEDLKEGFIQAGLIHIVVLSGYNVSLVAGVLMKTFSFLPRVSNLFVGAGAIALFVLMVGAPATAVRAGLMALLIVLAQALQRPRAILRGLLLAGGAMVLWNPYTLAFDPSFQLSFLATLGLILLGPWFESKLVFLPARFGLRSIGAATLSTQALVLPTLLYMSGNLSLVSLPANLLALTAVPFAMFFGFSAAALSFLPLLPVLPGSLATVFLSYIIAVAEIAAAVPYGSFLVRGVPLWGILCAYALIIPGAFILAQKEHRGHVLHIKRHRAWQEKEKKRGLASASPN